MQLVKEIDYNIDIVQLRKIVETYIYTDLAFRMEGFSMQHRLNVPDPWTLVDGLERLQLYPKDTIEQDFKYLNQLFKNTIIEKIVCDLKLFRTRAMIKEPKTCYTFHRDQTWRIHIPIITNPQCVFYFPDHNEQFHLEESRIYAVNTKEVHTFINGSNKSRIHFVGCIIKE